MYCQKCHSTEQLNRNSVTSTGKVQYICRTCNRERLHKYGKTEAGKLARRNNRIKTDTKFPDKKRARWKVKDALGRGALVRPENCESCDEETKLQAHHSDYTKPLTVQWLCTSCHSVAHKKQTVLI